jgi:signal transduction histidine kinase
VAGGRSIGVIEIVAPAEKLRDRHDVLGAVVAQSAIVLRNLTERRESDEALRAMAGMLRLAGELLRAATPSSAVQSAVQLCFRHIGAPVAGLIPDPCGSGWTVVAAHGLGPAKRAELQRSVQDVGARDATAPTMDRLAACFAASVGRRGAEPIRAGEAALIVAELGAGDEDFLRTVAAFLGEALQRIGAVDWAQTRNENLDLAIAWTAHELKGPLVGARAALGRVIVAEEDRTGQDLLRRSRDELGQLADLVDPLLRWSAGSSPLRLRRTDLVRIVRDAAAGGRLEVGETAGVVIEAPEHVWVRADARQLGRAIANVVRNAVSFEPQTTAVRVIVEVTDDGARVRVRDHGPGVPASERRLIFDPFARGMLANGRGGSGLGLFIARRIVDAHGGSIGLRSARPGTEFWVELPLAEERRSSSAS